MIYQNNPHLERIVILIDGNNLLQGARRYKNDIKIRFSKLIDFLASEQKLIRAYYFDCVPEKGEPSYEKKQKFIDMLHENGITVFHRPLRYRENGMPFQKGVDVALATELLSLCMQNSYDTTIIVSGDSDYTHAIQRVKDTGKRVYCASFKSCLSKELKNIADKVIILDNHIEKFTDSSTKNL